MMSAWLPSRGTVDVICTIDIEQTPESLHAHVELHGVDVGPGDQVIIHDAPTRVGFGERLVCERHATVVQAGVLGNLLARIIGYLELTELYEVSFSNGRVQ